MAQTISIDGYEVIAFLLYKTQTIFKLVKIAYSSIRYRQVHAFLCYS
jgi:hypothetical protein